MFFVYLFLMLIAIAGFCILVQEINEYKKIKNDDGWLVFGVFVGFISLVCLVIGGFASLFAVSNQIYDGQNLAKITQFESVYQRKADNLTNQFAKYLADAYPNHEKDIFDKIKPEEVDIYLVKYPALQASKTITELVAQIRSLNDDVYKQQLERAETLRDMRFRAENPWLIRRLIPAAPAEQVEK